MKHMITFAILLAAQTLAAQTAVGNGTSEAVVQGKEGFVRVEGASAKVLFESMTAVEAKNNQGEAGANLYFKDGKNLSCFVDVEMDPSNANAFACTIRIQNAATGEVK